VGDDFFVEGKIKNILRFVTKKYLSQRDDVRCLLKGEPCILIEDLFPHIISYSIFDASSSIRHNRISVKVQKEIFTL
jgi:hypothetical protein